jgi:cobalt/nickel transport system permease protein
MGEILSLLRRWRVPGVLTELIGLMYRLLFVFDRTLHAMIRAQGCRLGYRNLRTSYRSLGTALAALFIRSVDRAHRLERGLAARGYHGELRVLSCRHPVSRRAMLMIALVLLCITALGLLGQGGLPWPS